MPEFLEGTVDVPGAGRIKKAYIMVPAGLAAVYVAYRWYQASQGSGEDDGSSGQYESDDLSDMGLNTGGGNTNIRGNNPDPNDDDDDAPLTNAKWTQKAVELLGNAGYDGATVYAALGEFLGRRALDKKEASIARSALAGAGQPPVGGPYFVIEEAGTSTGTLPAPKDLKVWEKATSDTLSFQWDRVNGAAYYRIYRSDQGDEPMGASSDTKFRAKGLHPSKSYKFFVRAVGSTEKLGAKSSTITLKTLGIKLPKPTNLRASSITKNSFRVSCSEVKGAEYYRWYVNGTPYGASDDPYRDFTSRKPNTAYRIQVAADTINQVPGPWSAPLTVKTKR